MSTNMSPNEAQDSSAPELEKFHDAWFEASGPDIYGSPEDWSPIKRSGHERRMALLDQVQIADIDTKVAVDFGTGPWGFACVFPKLQNARSCVSIDVSSRALALARQKDREISAKVRYLTSDGEEIPLEDDSVDIFWGGEVIEHVRQPQRFMQEIARVGRDGCMVILTTPNRDAIYYRAARQEYTVGPEHIALMNCDELRACASAFLADVSIVGYETSLHPAVDDLISHAVDLELIQNRAEAFPDAASGLLVIGRVDKTRYASNRKTWHMREVLWSSAECLGHEYGERLRLFENVFGVSIDGSQSLKMSVPFNKAVLLFWAHDWSGIAAIRIDGREQRVDLFSPAGGFRRVDIEELELAEHSIEIVRTGQRRDCAHSDQVIFYKIIAYTVGRP